MKKVTVLVIAICISIGFMSGCNKSGAEAPAEKKPATEEIESEDEEPAEEEIEQAEAAEEESHEGGSAKTEDVNPSAILIEAYKEVLTSLDAGDDIYALTLDAPFENTVPIEYALEDMNKDRVPELLVGWSDDWDLGIKFVSVYSYDFKEEEISMAEGYLMHGAAGVGGYRGSLGVIEGDDGYDEMLSSSWAAGTGAGETYTVLLNNSKLEETFYSAFQVGDETQRSPEKRSIVWKELSDIDYLNNLEINDSIETDTDLPTDGSEAVSAEAEEDAGGSAEIEALIADAESRGLQILTGTFRVMNGEELAAYEDMDVRIGGADAADSTYVILELDTPQYVEGEAGDGSGRRTSSSQSTHVGVAWENSYWSSDNGDVWFDLDGKHGTIATDLWFQSDASFPFAPRCKNTELIQID